MNVAFDSWIPVVTTTGEQNLTSLCDVLAEGRQYADLAVRPHERVALMRLLLCVSHAGLDGPRDYDEWRHVPSRLPEAVREYLSKWKESFELFHPTRPWLQVAGLEKNGDGPASDLLIRGWTLVSKLNFSFATGNNTTLLDHAGLAADRTFEIGETLLWMLTFQCFSPGGLIAQVYWNSRVTGKSSKDAPCVQASMIHAFLRGATVQETIHLNLPTHEDIRLIYGDRAIGKPVWEMMPASMEDAAAVDNATATYVGRLVPMTRLIRLDPFGARMLLGDGLVYPVFASGFPPEPSATVMTRRRGGKDEERALLSYRPSEAIWRELPAMVVKRNAGGLGGPLCLGSLRDGEDCDLVAAALARDRAKATILDSTESVFHVPSRLRSSEGAAAYESEVKTAENLASRLGWAVETYRQETDQGWEGRLKAAGPGKGELKAKLRSLAATHFWTTVERNVPLLMAHVQAVGTEAADPTRKAWRKMLTAAALESFRAACGQSTPRQMRAFAKGWQRLAGGPGEPEADTPKSKEENA
ncbi:MAG: type I-E CRISPR-associated protein Cse1/CasA [bacterium]